LKKTKVPVEKILKGLQDEYPDVRCALDHRDPLQLLVATILSAQCTDVRVNLVTPALFAKYPAAVDFATRGSLIWRNSSIRPASFETKPRISRLLERGS
jgi:endonuclease III